MNLNITFDKSLPAEFHTLAERALRTAIDYLDSQPRPKATPPIESFIPEWEKLKFTVGADGWARGMYSMNSMAGWAVINVRLNGDCVFGLAKPITILNVDIELATVIECVGMLDSYFYKGIDSDRQLRRQLQYVDSISATDGRARSLLDQLDEQIKAEEAAQREDAYKNQFVVKHQQYRQRLKEARYIRTPSWFWAKNPDAIVSQHEAPQTAPAPKPTYCKHEPQAPLPPAPLKQHPAPTLSPEDAQALESIERQNEYMASYCLPDCSTEDHDK